MIPFPSFFSAEVLAELYLWQSAFYYLSAVSLALLGLWIMQQVFTPNLRYTKQYREMNLTGSLFLLVLVILSFIGLYFWMLLALVIIGAFLYSVYKGVKMLIKEE